MSHHDQQILKQQSISQHLGIPVITVCLGIGNFVSSRGTYAICSTADRTQLAGNQGTKIDGGIEMVDLVVLTVIVAPAIPIVILRYIRAAEMVDTILLPTLRIDLRPLHHSVAAKGGVCDLRSGAVNLLGIIVGIEIMIHSACISQHTGARHKLLTRVKCPTAIAELSSAEIHSSRSKRRIIHIRRISYSSGRTGGCFDQIVAEQVVSLLRGYTGSVCLAAIIGSGAGVRECRVVIHHANRYICICISAVRSDVLEQLALGLTGWITSCASANDRTCDATRKLCRDLNLNGVGCRNIHRLSGKCLHRLRLIDDYTVSFIPVIHALGRIRECSVIVSSGGRSFSVSKACGLLNVSD